MYSPALKRYVRQMGGYLNAARQLEVLNRLPGTATFRLEEVCATAVNLQMIINQCLLRTQAVAITQHHDAVAGTAKQHVSYDYAKRCNPLEHLH